jgi:hypothetical protein
VMPGHAVDDVRRELGRLAFEGVRNRLGHVGQVDLLLDLDDLALGAGFNVYILRTPPMSGL